MNKKFGRNENRQLNEQVLAIADKLLEYDCITINQHQRIESTFKQKILQVEKRVKRMDNHSNELKK